MLHRIPFIKTPPRVSVVRLTGMIANGSRALNDQNVAPLIEAAFTKGKPSAVALVINSPGGSPVQSSLIGARIRRLSQEKGIPVHAFVEDVAASGGYWLACAADDIWVDNCSVVGSIGVISAGFGAHVFLSRQGIERRVHTAGKSKSMMDPFKPETPEDVARLDTILNQIHGSFIDHVKSRRGAKLADNPDLFTGEVWIGPRAAEVGLVDGVGHLRSKLKEIYGDKVKLIPYSRRRGLFGRFGAELASDALAGIEERAAFARFGL